MADLEAFRKKIRRYYRQIYREDGRTKYQQRDLADAIAMNEDELGKRLHGYRDEKTERVWRLTEENVLDIVLVLAEWQALDGKQAVELLALMDYPLETSSTWKAKLQKHFSLPELALFPWSKEEPSAIVPVVSQASPQIPPHRRIFQAPDLPKGYVPRPKAFKKIKHLLLTQEENQTTAITTALRGAGGFGKTTLASALCHDSEIQATFPDGILWIELGEHPPGSLAVLNELLHALEPSERGVLTLEEARIRWRQALEKRACLLVIDDVWQKEALKELLQGGPRCVRLVTTRNDQMLPDDARRVWVDAMEPDEAMTLLCQGVIDDWQHELNQPVLEHMVVQQLGCWPLLLSLAKGMLTIQVKRLHKPPEQALAQVERAYEDRGMAAFHMGDRIERHRRADMCIEVNLCQLEEWVSPHYQASQRYQELAVFSEGTDIPLSTLQIYWQRTGGLKEWEVEELCLHLSDLSLVLPWNPGQGIIRLHDVMHNYLIQHAGTHLPALHSQLLDAYQQILGLIRWADLPQSEVYLWQHLILHLSQAGHPGALQDILTDLSYLTRKALYMGVSALEADLRLASISQQTDDIKSARSLFEFLHRTIMRISHLLRQVETPSEMGGLLLSHLGSYIPLSRQRTVWERELIRPFLTTWHPLQEGFSSALFRTLSDHIKVVNACAFSPDGSWIVSASNDCTLKVWDVSSGLIRLTLRGHTGPVRSCAISDDGSLIVSASDDATLKVWDASNGERQRTLRGHIGPVFGCAFSPDGDKVVSGGWDHTLRVWDRNSGNIQHTLRGHTHSVKCCVMSRGGDRVLIASASYDGTLKVWDPSSGETQQTLSGHIGPVFGCAFSPDGKKIASSSFDGTLKIWDTVNGKMLCTLHGHASPVWSCAFSPDGNRIVSASEDYTVKVWDISNEKECLTFQGHTSSVFGCAVNPNGKLIVSASEDNTLKIWNIIDKPVHPLQSGHTDFVKSCAFSPDGSWVVSASWDHTLKVWNTSNGAVKHTLYAHSGWVNNCAVSPNGKFIASASEDNTLKIWDETSGKVQRTLWRYTDEINSCAFSPDGEQVISASNDGTLKILEVSTGKVKTTLRTGTGSMRERKFNANSVKSCAFSSDGSWVVSASDSSLNIWDAKTRKQLFTYDGHGYWAKICAFSLDRGKIISASSDHTLKVWNILSEGKRLSLEECLSLKGHINEVNDCAVSPNGYWIISVSFDSTLKVWDAQTGQCMLTFPVDGALFSCAFHPDGEHLVACGMLGVYFLRLVV
jgi:WD40 repeat protein